MSVSTAAVIVVKSGTSFTIDVTAANLLTTSTIKDFKVINIDTDTILDNTNFTKDSATQISYSGADIGTNVNLEVRRDTPVNRFQELLYNSKLASSVLNTEFDRVLRRQAEYTTFGAGPTSSGISSEPLNQAYGVLWATDTVRGRVAKVIYDKIELVVADIATNAASIAANILTLATKADLNTPAFTGSPTAPTPPADNNSTRLATTAYVQTELNDFAPLASPALTGVPTAPTASIGTDTTQLATTAFVIANGGGGGEYCLINETQTAGTQGGAAVSGSWIKRTLNTKTTDEIGITLANSNFTLPGATKPGKYLIRWSAPAFDVDGHQSRLYNNTAAGAVQQGTSEASNSVSDQDQTRSFGSYIANVSADTTFSIEHRVNTSSSAGNGFGVNPSVGSEVFTVVEIIYLDVGRSNITLPTDLDYASPQFVLLEDQKAQNVDGGTFTLGAWQTRDLNTVASTDEVGITLSSNQITLPGTAKPGKYLIEWEAPAYDVDLHQSRLYSVTDTAEVKAGSSEYASAADQVQTSSKGRAIVDISADTTYRIEHRSSATSTTTGFGRANNQTTEVYTKVKISYLDGTRVITGGGISATADFESAEQSINSNARISISHGLGGLPRLVRVVYRCKIAEAGWSPGDEIESFFYDASGTNYGVMVGSSSTDVTYNIWSGGVVVPRKDIATAGAQVVTPANWRIVVYAWA